LGWNTHEAKKDQNGLGRLTLHRKIRLCHHGSIALSLNQVELAPGPVVAELELLSMTSSRAEPGFIEEKPRRSEGSP
jgi:hypothetical protein